jgi:hypothetical protein
MAATAHRIVAEKYTIQAVRDQYLNLIDSLAAGPQATVLR